MSQSGQKRFCSACGQQMDWRLNRWECPACGHHDDPAVAEAARRKQEELERIVELKGNVRGIQNKPVYQDGRVVGYESDAELTTYKPPTSSALLNPGPSFYGAIEDMHQERRRNPGLETEKKVYFAIHAIGVLISVLSSLGSSAVPGGPGFGYALIAMLIPALYVYLLWIALFGDQEWAKWIAGGLAGLSVVAAYISMFYVMSFDPAMYATLDFTMRGGLSAVLWTATILHSIMAFWLIGILYRDMKVLQGR